MRKLRILIPLLCFVIVIILLRFVFYIGYVPTESMEPTIPAGSNVIGIRMFHELNVGDIIVFEHEGKNMVKRIAACPEDTIRIQGKQTKVPKGCYYVLGDNSSNSYDSRYWQDPFLLRDKIKARIIYPCSQIRKPSVVMKMTTIFEEEQACCPSVYKNNNKAARILKRIDSTRLSLFCWI